VSNTVTALYDSHQEAARALRFINAEVSLTHADIYDRSEASIQALRRLNLTPEERAACEDKVATGEYLLLARPRSGEGPENVIAALERAAEEPVEEDHSRTSSEAAHTIVSGSPVLAEERFPVVEEELRVGIRTVVRGGARVHTRVEEIPVVQEAELMSEFVRVASHPTSRSVSEQELEQGGLLRNRVIEIAEMREEAVVTKEVWVREEVVVSKITEHRVEQIHETVRRTVVETEDLGTHATRGGERP
jgi:hypothetical protein